ncbi:MAG: class I SAM-dependent methyltransferase [Pseudomonadota bacterium]
MQRFRFAPDGDVGQDIRDKYNYDGDLLEHYTSIANGVVHKWHHYIPLYDRYFARWRNKPVRFLEIGVRNGGSMEMWRKYFGDDALLYGIDIDERCARFDGRAAHIRIGSQDDVAFVNGVIDEMGGVDIILDDGSHHMDHVPVSFEALFPRLTRSGVYMIEDLHTAYLRRFGGGMHRDTNFFNMVRNMCDDMHRWYHKKPLRFPDFGKEISGIHIHDSVVVIEKDPVHAPQHSWVGSEIEE